MIARAVSAALRAGNVVLAAAALLLPIESAWAQACPSSNRVAVDHRNSYCELCGVGEVTIRVDYDANGADPDITNLLVRENLNNPALVPIPGTTTFDARFGPDPAPFDPVLSGGQWTWDFGNYVLEGRSGQFLDITFQVRRANGVDEEGLYSASKSVTASFSYTTDTDSCATETDTTNLPFRAPNPEIIKLGRNVDAGQGSGQYSDPVYGHNNDDIIWRIEIRNNGLAAMQDVRLDDLMQPGNVAINYACPTEASASAIANNNGGGPIPAGCMPASNTIGDFVVADPFGSPATTNYPNGGATNGFTRDINGRDIDAGGSAFIYLVGKITADASCTSGGRTNTVSDVQFGCDADNNGAGGIPAGSDTATLRTFHGDTGNHQLTVQRRFTGVNTVGTTAVSARPVGARGLVILTITNNTGGTVKDIYLEDVLPPEYVVDPTYWSTGTTKPLPVRATPTQGESSINPQYGAYAGMIDRITWLNPQGSLAPPSQDPLQNTRPRFRLWSSAAHPDYPEQIHMLRQGDVVTVTFPIVLISQDRNSVEPYDLRADLDVTPEVTADGTDPAYTATLSNQLTVDYNTFCSTQGNNGAGSFRFTYNDNNIAAFPEDLDIAITDINNNPGSVFILTNDPNQQLPLRVRVTNNGGHPATNYRVFASFGATMQVVTAPAGCSLVALSGSPPQPNPWKVWVQPSPIPATAAVYQCTSPASIAPGATVNLDFYVIKTSDPARIALDDLTFRADVVGEISLYGSGTPYDGSSLLWFPAPITRPDGQLDRTNNYSLDGVRQRVIGFNLVKTNLGCNENNPAIFDPGPYTKPAQRVEIGEECTYRVQTGGWFGFETPGFIYIAVEDVAVTDNLPSGQGYVSSTNPYLTSSGQIAQISLMGVPVPPQPNGLIAPGAPFSWNFNQTSRITQLDEWFDASVTTRVLNNPVNVRADPNRHTANSHNVLVSTFDAIFADENGEFSYPLGPNAVGYPSEAIRREDLTITEPHLVVEKHVCNESRYGAGAACSNWTTLTNEGDTYDSYIYRITVRNQAAVDGLASAPAYDVVVTDTLDASDLVYVVPFAGDGLDNDGDGLVGGGDPDEGAISDNTVLNGIPAVITFSHTHSTALRRINPGSQVQLYYRVDPDQRIAPMQVLTNAAGGGYDTLAGSTNESGNQTVDPRPNSDIGGARVYATTTAQAQVQIIPLQTFPKEIVALSATPLGGTPQPVKIGEEIRYRLTANLPVARLRSFFIQDYLPAGLTCAQAPAVDLNQPPYDAAGFRRPDGSLVPPVTPTCSGNSVIWDFGDVVLTQKPSGSTYFVFQVSFIARVDNSAGNNNAVVLSNGTPATNATLYYLNDLNQQVILEFGQIDVVVREPAVAITKSFAPVANADAADELTVTVTATNNGTADAYNLRIWDDLVDRHMTFIQGSVSGTDPPTVDAATFGANRPVFVWAPTQPLAPGATRTFTFRVRVDATAQPLQVLDNTLQAAWTSLPGQTTALNSSGQIGPDGSPTGMRIGRLPNSSPADPINDYESTATASVSVPPVVLTKTDNDPSVVPTIGAHKSFTIEIALPEGTTNSLVATDSLAAGGVSYVLTRDASFGVAYEFIGIASINGQAPAEAAFNAFPANGASGSVAWNIGTVVTQTENDLAVNGINPRIRITYHARINNDLVTDAGDTLRNGATATYRHGETGAPEAVSDQTAQITVLEPLLGATKSVTNLTRGPGNAEGGDILQYAVTITNSGGATARDVNVADTLPAGVVLNGSFVPTATVAGVPVAGFNPTPTINGNGATVWGRDNGDNSLAVPPGQSLVLTYQVVVQQAGGALTNTVYVDWTSLGGASVYERTGAGCPSWTAPNDYCVGPVTTTTSTIDTTSLTKARVSDSWAAGGSTAADGRLRVGDTAVYRLSLNLREGITPNVRVRDALDAGLAFDGIVSVNGVTTAPFVQTPPFTHDPVAPPSVSGSTGTGVTLLWTLGDIHNATDQNPANNAFVIEYRVRVVENVLPHQPSVARNNTATLMYTDGSGAEVVDPARLVASAQIDVRQPVITAISKIDRSGASRTGTGTQTNPYVVNIATDVMNFQLQACNTNGLAPAYGVRITDVLATELDETSIVGPVVTINGAVATGGVDYTYTPPAGRGGTLGFLLSTPVDPGQCVTITYDIGFHTDVPANQVWSNSASVGQYWSLPPANAQEYVGITPVPPAAVWMTNTATMVPPAKVLSSPASGEATIGEEVVYRITVPGTAANGALYDVVVTDALHPSLAYVGATATLGGNPLALTDNTTGNNVSLRIAQIPAGQRAVIDLRARVANNGEANAGVSFTNTAGYSYATSPGGTPVPGGDSTTATPLRLVEPLLAINKAVANLTSPGNPPTAGDTLRYTLTLPASGGTAGDNYSGAFDLGIVDNLSLGLAYRAGTATVDGAGNTIADPLVTGDGVATPQTLTWSLAAATADIDVVEGATVTVTYDVLVLNGVQANQALVNSATVQWTGLDGASPQERTGAGCPTITAPNDYCAGPATTTLTTPDNTTLAKVRLTDTYGAGDANLRVGDLVEYELRIGLQEGQHQNLVLTDTLPRGLAFEGIVSINGDATAPYGAVAPFTHADIAGASVSGDPVTGPTTVTWNLGNVVNVPDGSATNDVYVIAYRARVVNEVHPQVNSITLTNSAELGYSTGTGSAQRTAGTSTTLLQPMLTVSKTAAPAGGDTVIQAGELITYTVDVANTGAAPAYDLVLRDVIPVGLRNGAATITMLNTSLLSGPALPNLAPAYDAATGVATWNFDTGAANAYTIPAGDTLRLVYRVQADADLGAGLTLTNQAQVQRYYSFDDEAVPALGGVSGVREIYGPSNAATTTLTTALPSALDKQNPAVTNVAIGQPFTYRITVPATPAATALHDVRILDDLAATGADLRFVGVAKVSGSQPWTPVNTGTSTQLVIEDPAIGIDIPAGEQAVIDITVVLNDSPANVSGLQFSNTASYTFNQVANNPATRQPGGSDTTGNLTIVGPDTLTMDKSGPAQMRPGVPGAFTLDVHNAGSGTAWGATVTDLLPNPTPGGMCDAAPSNITAQLYQADGVTPVGGPLVAGSDFTASFTGAPSCTFTITMQSAAGAIPAGHRLIIHYQASLDADNVNGTSLTNVAGVTRWYGADPAGGATPRTYTRALTNGTVGTLDHEDAHTVVIETAVLVFRKTVQNMTSGNPTAEPGDVLRYTLRIQNISPVPVLTFSLLDELDRLNTPPVFQPGSLTLITVPAGADASQTSGTGGARGTGLVDIRRLTLTGSDGAPGGADELLIVYEARLVSSIANGTVVRNQAQLLGAAPVAINSDDPNINGPDDPNVAGDEDPTQIGITSAPAFRVQKTSDDMTGDSAALIPGDTLRYTITVKNVGNEDAVNVVLQDAIPPNTTYVANSTTLNGASVPDVGGNTALQAGMLIHAPENPTPGAMRADADPAAGNVATIAFEVVVNADAVDGTVIANQGLVNGTGAGGVAFPQKPSDDPATPDVDDPTRDTVVRPNGIVYDSIRRVPLAGVTLRMLRASDGGRVPESCFNDPAQQDQVTAAGGYYKFDLNFSDPVQCPPDQGYVIAVTAVPTGYDATPSRIVPPTTSGTTGAYSVPLCPADAVPATEHCEAQVSDTVPTGAAATTHYLHVALSNAQVPADSQIFNNHIAVDPELEAAIAITKTTPLINVTRAQLVPYTITVKNTLGGSLQNLAIIDTLPPGFKYVEGSSRFDGNPLEPVSVPGGLQLRWENLELAYNQTHTIKLLLVVGSGVAEGEYANRAVVRNTVLDQDVSGVATATVRVVPDPTFDCTDIIGKVYDDANLNGHQDPGEKGVPGVRVVSARGLIAKTDAHGRFHITCAAVPNEDRGSNFILKVDDRSLPSGYRLTTENPLVERVTRGKAAKFNFGAALHRVVRLDIAAGVFEPDSTEVRPQWATRFGLLLEELRKAPAVLRVSYLADVEEPGIVKARLEAMKREVARRWAELKCCDPLKIETEIFWRRGGPPDRKAIDNQGR